MNRYLFLCFILSRCALTLSAQEIRYDLITYSAPENWKAENTESYVSYSKIDGGSWAQIAIYKSTASRGTVEADSEREWNAIVLAAHEVENPEKTKPESAEGWSVMSRSGVWQHEGINVATILTTFSNGQVCISILCNATAQPYLRTYQQLIASVEFAPAASREAPPQATVIGVRIVGLWAHNFNEASGYANGVPLTSGGYFRKEYLFNADGTYQYRAKNWSTLVKDIQYIRETGTYTVRGNQLTLTPDQGDGGWWGKSPSGRTEGWGTYQKPYAHPLEQTTYTFEINYLSGMEEYYLILRSKSPTARDGHQGQAPYEFNYSRTDAGKALIDNPPGRKLP